MQIIKMVAAFIMVGATDMIKLQARILMPSMTVRPVWLHLWLADPASKKVWVKIPFAGASLFGNKLDPAIFKATGGTFKSQISAISVFSRSWW